MPEQQEKLVIIPKSEYDDLRRDAEELNALRNYGVDNWDGYGDHRDELDLNDDGDIILDDSNIRYFDPVLYQELLETQAKYNGLCK
jgi:hypothetical protein